MRPAAKRARDLRSQLAVFAFYTAQLRKLGTERGAATRALEATTKHFGYTDHRTTQRKLAAARRLPSRKRSDPATAIELADVYAYLDNPLFTKMREANARSLKAMKRVTATLEKEAAKFTASAPSENSGKFSEKVRKTHR